jgi:hypothetical protein
MKNREALIIPILNAIFLTFIGLLLIGIHLYLPCFALIGFLPGIIVASVKNSKGEYRWELGQALIVSFIAAVNIGILVFCFVGTWLTIAQD